LVRSRTAMASVRRRCSVAYEMNASFERFHAVQAPMRTANATSRGSRRPRAVPGQRGGRLAHGERNHSVATRTAVC
jgi:hypothetical protein